MNFPKIPKHEFKAVLRSLNIPFRPGEKSQAIWERITAQGIQVRTITDKHAIFKKGLAGQLTGGVTVQQVMEIVDGKIEEIEMPIAQVDMKAVEKMVNDLFKRLNPNTIVIEQGKPPVKLTGRRHPMFEKVLRLVRAGVNVMLVGPAGAGKSHLANDVANALKRKFGALHCTAGASESQLTGWLLPIEKGGNFVYVPSEFVRMFRDGYAVFLLDEMDAADPNMLLVINGALAGQALHIPQNYKEPHVKRGDAFAVIAACNTHGTGADIMFAGRNQLDAATLDRFYVVEMDYDDAYEADLYGGSINGRTEWTPAPKETTEEDVKALGGWVHALRRKTAALGKTFRRTVGTRMIQKSVAARRAGIPMEEIKRDMLAG